MANLIQIKRSTSTASPTSLANGEFAYSSNGNVLFIGANGAVEAIGGKRTPGTLTANQALVANSSSGIDKIVTANAVLQKVYANGSHGTAGYLLATDSGGNTFWQNPANLTTSAGGSDTQVQFNSGGAFAGDSGLTFNSTTDTLSTNTVQSNTVNAAVHSVGTSFIANSTGVTTTGFANVGTTLAAGNTTITGFANVISDSAVLRVGNATSFSVSNTSGHYPVSNTLANALGAAGSRWALNATTGSFAGAVSGITTLAAGNTTITGFANVTSTIQGGSSLTIAGALSGVTTAAMGNTTITGFANVTSTIQGGSSLTIAGALSGVTTAAMGNTTITGFANVSTSVNSAILSVGTSFIANTTGAYHTGTTNSAVLSVGTNFVANTTQVTAAVPVVMNANVTIGDAATDVLRINADVGTNIIPSANVTYNLGAVLERWDNLYVRGITSETGSFTGNVSISGDLLVTGNVTTINVSSLSVSDPVIKLAANNTASDSLWLGFTGHYNGQGNTTNHAGLARNPTDKEFYMFGTYGNETLLVDNNTINTADPSFSLANLNVYLKSGGLVTNSSVVAITANSTVAVNITANSLTLSTPLAATSGGTGFNTYGSGDILVANSGNALSKLSLGSDGKLLQSNGSALIYADLDGGTF
jgi:hypothetical protein